MQPYRTALIGAAAVAALLGTAAASFAQTPAQDGRVIAVPPGAVVLVLPAGALQPAAFPFPDMPSPIAMIREMDQMMADMQQSFAAEQAALRNLPPMGGPVAGVVVTSFSDGHGTCTQRITYPGNGAAPVVQVSSTGNACAGAGLPATMPEVGAPSRGAPHLIQVRDQSRPAAPLTYAMAGGQ